MSDNRFDVIVVGGGPGGFAAAVRASQLGAKTLLIEKDQLGGTCLNRGCIPTKAIIACTNLNSKIQQANKFGISAENLQINLKAIIERKNRIVTRQIRAMEYTLKQNNVEVVHGEGALKGQIVQVGTQNFAAAKVILAMGAAPISIPGVIIDKQKFLTSDEVLENTEVPKKLDIVGGGIIGVHFAAIYSSLGTKVTIYEALPEILPGLDLDLVQAVKTLLKRKGVEIKTNTHFNPQESGGKTIICVGRKPISKIEVNDKLETNQPGIYAIGDVLGKKMLAHIASEQGVIAAENALAMDHKGSPQKTPRVFSYDNIPITIYTHPEIGSVGMTAQEANQEKHKIAKYQFAASGYASALGETEGFIKLIADKITRKILGMHIFGAGAADLIGIGTLAVKQGLTADQLANTIQAHPSMPEGLQETALSLISD